MEMFLIFLGVILITSFVKIGLAGKERKYFYAKRLIAPPWADMETKRLFQQFNRAWSSNIEKTVNIRVKKEKRTLRHGELREHWYELKKYLLLAGISKGLPMFSTKVDDLWHFFLEEKELYNEFCQQFIGERIEHHPHETPMHLPKERAWFDILYLTFFTVSSHSHVWGKFVQEKDEHANWAMRMLNGQEEILESFGRHRSDDASTQTLFAFLKFAREEMMEPRKNQENRVMRVDGYWYGPAMFGMYGYTTFDDDQKKDRGSSYADGSSVYANSPDRKEEWNDMVADVNTFNAGTDAGAMPGASSDGGGSDSGSSCSSCSGCSS